MARVSGATPLALGPPPPRRAPPPPPLAAADIMQLPIVFADDEAPPAADAPRRLKYARVIVAKRGGGAVARGAVRVATPRE